MKAGWHGNDRLLCLDWTLLRLFPPLRATWALKGTQAVVPITGRNAKRVLFGAIDLQSARRVVLIRPRAGQTDAQAFLRALRRRYRRAGWLWLLTDRASAHTAPQTQALADRLRIRFVWLPRQAPELSPMDQLWRELKRLIAANRQAASIEALAANAADWVLTLTPQQARRKAGMASKRFWLRKLLQNFWRPT
ncbi:MAG TPA: transposase [Hyphomicrobiaceae bacterium]|nr:transposase [Hyphomicrobiaceae bacterium]